jgi:signal transduction histidine kinase
MASMGSEEELRSEIAELRAREARLLEGLQRQVDLSRRLREYAAHLRAKLREPARRGAEAVFAEVAEVSAEALGVARVSVWLVDAGRQVLVCHHLHVRGSGPRITSELPLADLQRYVRALTTDLVAADDVIADARVRELQAYCADREIGALLDVPVIADGEVLGVVCHEHVGGARVWHGAEIDFAANLGSVVALAIEAERRHAAQDRAHAAVAEQLRLEAELAQQRKFESLGRMATAVAHDFNHVLTVISLSLERGAKATGAGAPVSPIDPEIGAAMAYARELVSSLLSYARREPVAVQDVEVDAVIGELVPVLATAIGKELQLDADLRAAGGRVRIAPTELRQLVVNMVTNAGDATRGHGHTVRVATAVITGAAAPGRMIELQIFDDGRGMDEATRARVFDPFFTTKPAGAGTGIGLATCQSIVARAGGTIAVDSEPGVGTTFRIRLPEAAGPAAAAAPPAPAAGPAAGHRLLLVEDSPAIGGLVSGALREAGYEVVHVTSVAQALAAIEAERFGAVVADLRLPDGRGEQIVAAARARSEQTAIIVASGEVAVLGGVDAVVMKPFTAEELKAGLARALEQRRAAR